MAEPGKHSREEVPEGLRESFEELADASDALIDGLITDEPDTSEAAGAQRTLAVLEQRVVEQVAAPDVVVSTSDVGEDIEAHLQGLFGDETETAQPAPEPEDEIEAVADELAGTVLEAPPPKPLEYLIESPEPESAPDALDELAAGSATAPEPLPEVEPEADDSCPDDEEVEDDDKPPGPVLVFPSDGDDAPNAKRTGRGRFIAVAAVLAVLLGAGWLWVSRKPATETPAQATPPVAAKKAPPAQPEIMEPTPFETSVFLPPVEFIVGVIEPPPTATGWSPPPPSKRKVGRPPSPRLAAPELTTPPEPRSEPVMVKQVKVAATPVTETVAMPEPERVPEPEAVVTPPAVPIQSHPTLPAPQIVSSTPVPEATPAPEPAAPEKKAVVIPPFQPPVPIDHPQPAYPEAAKKRREIGTIVLKVLVSETGRVVRVVVDDGLPGSHIEAAAIETVLHWKYEPAMENGHPIRAWATEEFTFKP